MKQKTSLPHSGVHSLQESLLRQELGDYFSLRLQVYLQVGPSGACLAQPLIQVDAWGGWGSSRCFLPGLWVLPTTQGRTCSFSPVVRLDVFV